MTALLTEEKTSQQKHDDDETHISCCIPNKAMCGVDTAEANWVSISTEVTCVVCADLEFGFCPDCGE